MAFCSIILSSWVSRKLMLFAIVFWQGIVNVYQILWLLFNWFVYNDSICFTLFKLYSLDKLIMEAITSLKENGGSNKTAIAAFIEVYF